MADIKCNICGTMNPPANTICQTCGASLSQGGDSIQPGQMPTRQPTSELEPVLPDWLRNARDASQDQPAPEKELPPSAPPMSAPSAASDLLAGLRAQAEDDDEEIPDWLAGITGADTGKKKTQPEVSGSRRVELGSPSKPESVQESEELPSWLSSLSAPQEPVRDDRSNGWSSLLGARLEVVEVGGTHMAMMQDETLLARIAGPMNRALLGTGAAPSRSAPAVSRSVDLSLS